MGKPSKDYDPVKDGSLDGQFSFDFCDWKDAFETFYRKKRMDLSYCLVISTHWASSGYWVERNAKGNPTDKVYRSVKAVQALEQRVKDRIEETKVPRERPDGKTTMVEVVGIGLVL